YADCSIVAIHLLSGPHIMKKLTIPLLLSTLSLSACHTMRPVGERVDASLLQYADANKRNDVAKARSAADEASDSVAVAKRKISEAKGNHVVAEKELEVARARHEKVRSELAVAGRPEDESEAMTQARQDVHAAECALRVREAEIRVAEHELRAAQERHELARARVDLAAAEAVASVDRAECRNIDVADFERRVRAEEADVKVAEVRLEEATRDVEARRAATANSAASNGSDG
ncbi:MAG: hypothetical protein ABIP94_14090, partial [Planctomycetota bacterium]